MKKTIILSVLAFGMIFTSCSMGGASLKTSKDSVSYAIGSSVGEMAFGFDSTLNVDVMVAAVRDVYSKNPKLTREQAQQQIQLYVQSKQVDAMKAENEKFGVDSLKNAEASAKYLAAKEADGFSKTESGLLYKIENPGADAKVALGDSVTVNYKLTLTDGTVFDSSYDRNQPMSFINDPSGMIKGFVEGVSLLGKGGKATIVVPAELGYGANQRGGVGPAQALTFEIEVLDASKSKTK